MQKLLLVKTRHKKLPAEDGVPEDLIFLDKLCHGLLTQAIYRGSLKDLSKGLVCFRPEQGPLDVVILMSDLRSGDLDSIRSGFPSAEKAFWSGAMSSSELQALRKHLPKLEEWGEKSIETN